MENYIVICEGCSSAILYIEEALKRGFKPIIVDPPVDVVFDDAVVNAFEQKVGKDAIRIKMKKGETIDDLFHQLKKYDKIAAIVAGADFGVRYADELAEKFGLPGNNSKTTALRSTKYGMYSALKKAGLRAIETAIVKKESDIDDFCDRNKTEDVFMKYNKNASSANCMHCKSREEAKKHFRELVNGFNIWGEKVDILIQEYINGKEIVLNTISCEGKHFISDMWEYELYTSPDGITVYDILTAIDIKDADKNLVDYAMKVMDAVDVKYGPCHNEFMIDSKGPVLIETNARPMGGFKFVEYLDMFLEHHVSDLSIDCFTNPKKFFEKTKNTFKLKKSSIEYLPISVKSTFATIKPFSVILNNTPSFKFANPAIPEEKKKWARTTDFETVPVIIKFVGEVDEIEEIKKLLRKIEIEFSEIIFCEDDHVNRIELKTDINSIASKMKGCSNILVVTNDGCIKLQNGNQSRCSDNDKFNGCIYAVTKESTLTDRYRSLFDAISKIEKGAKMIVVSDSCEGFPYGSKGLELILQMANMDAKSVNDSVEATKK